MTFFLLLGLKKKLNTASNSSGNSEIKDWIQGIINNVYWVADSTPNGDGDLMLAKFSSIINHVMNVHRHENRLFPKCAHGELPERKWIQPGIFLHVHFLKSLVF